MNNQPCRIVTKTRARTPTATLAVTEWLITFVCAAVPVASHAQVDEPVHCVRVVEVKSVHEVPFLKAPPKEVESEWRWNIGAEERVGEWTLSVGIPASEAPRRVTTRRYDEPGGYSIVGSVAYDWCIIGASSGRNPSAAPELKALAAALHPGAGLGRLFGELAGDDSYAEALSKLAGKICRTSDLEMELASYQAGCYTEEQLRALPLEKRLEVRLWQDLWAPPYGAQWCYVLRRGDCVTLIETSANDPEELKSNFAIQRYYKGKALWTLVVWQGRKAEKPDGWQDFVLHVLRTAIDNECPTATEDGHTHAKTRWKRTSEGE